MLKIATWNVNSLRVRLSQVLDWLGIHQPDILALQEIKLENKDFPVQAFEALGYHAIYSGQKTYNGVAFLSRGVAADIMTDIPSFEDPQRRILGATFQGVRIINLYVPNGESPDSTKYQYKLTWLKQVTEFIKGQLLLYPRLVVLGDFNIAPEEDDVHDPTAWEGHVLFSQPERLALQALLKCGLQDTFRLFTQEKGHYSWWDYRAAAFRRNLGLRIDHVLASNVLAKECTACEIDVAPRRDERPSDHAPVIATFENIS